MKLLASTVSRVGRPAGRMPAAGPARARLRRALERRQVERDQRARRAQAPRLHEQDPGPHADHQFLRRSAAGARLVDLPGYGYARVPQALRAQWQELVGAYLNRADARWRGGDHGRAPSADAARPQLLELARRCARCWCCFPRPTSSRARSRPRRCSRRCAALQREVLLFSSVTRQGVEECRDLLEALARAGRAK